MEKRVFTCFLLYFAILSLCSAKPRNILFIVADDLGWNDVGFHNPDMITPNIDKLAYSGIILNKSYVQPVCTPSRNSWMSGYYPFRSGLQHGALLPKQAVCAPLNRTFLPQELKKLDYATHMIGKLLDVPSTGRSVPRLSVPLVIPSTVTVDDPSTV
ncbi:hypothetical protein FSP39_004277 [Pinctada imbricata]|uniref:Sulfatase N-terminal domain-containing protein n=1 Tax=Pinctada imbricata TaxID=66713 RepID=A0AA88YWV9_PINIB|nr:hypothetical protein FSP39_004277 [Pinctada imbricata]